MLDISEKLKNIYRNDRIPLTASPAHIVLKLYFPDLDFTLSNDKIDGETFELNESLCHGDDLVFGSCEASQLKITIADINVDLSGQTMVVTQTVNDTYTLPIGTFTVKSCKRKDDQWFREIIAYDNMKKFDVDVSDWYNGLFHTGDETYTLAQFRASLLAHFNIEEDTSNLPLPNDNMIVEKTIEPTQISGRTVMEACEEINGCFGRMGRNGKFKHIVLQPGYGLYPSETLYPADDLYPVDENNTSYVHESIIDETIGRPMYKEVKFEEYTVKEIDKLIIRSEEDDIGAIVGTGTNGYIIQGNFLVAGKPADELKGVASNILGNIAKRPYRPYKSEGIGLPYVEVGDSLEFATNEPVTGYVLQRTLSGIQALIDKYTAQGKEKREQNFGLNTEIIQLKGRQAILKKNIDEVSVNLSDLEENVDTSFEITHGEINLKVDKAGVISSINLTPEDATIKASKINFNGYATFDNNGNITSIDGSILKTGTVIADTVKADWVYTGSINANQITAGTIVADSVKSSWVYTGDISANQITAGSISGDRISGGTITGAKINSVFHNGSDTITIGMSEISFRLEVNASGVVAVSELEHGSLNFRVNGNTRASYGKDSMYIGSGFRANSSGQVSCSTINGYTPITSGNMPTIPSYTNQIYASNTGYGNIDFLGFDNAAGVNWVQANFAPKTSSDVRLKYDMHSLDSIPNELFMSLKPKQFKFKTDKNGKGIYFGLIAQELENAFSSHGLNPYDYAIIELDDVRKYTDDGMYVDGETHRINYIIFIPWMVKIIQEQNDRIIFLEDTVHKQNERISILEEKLYNS